MEDLEFWKRQAQSAQWTLYFVLKETGPVTIRRQTIVEDDRPADAAVLDAKDESDNLMVWAGRQSEVAVDGVPDGAE